MAIVHVRFAQNHMATTFDFTISCSDAMRGRAEVVLEQAHRRVGQLEDELTEFRNTSPVYRLNQAPPGEGVEMPQSALELLVLSERLRMQTAGAFDCQSKSEPGAARVCWDQTRRVAWRTDRRSRLGFGAIGKGYAIDRVRALLEAEGFQDWVLNAGGSSIAISGFAAPGEPWTFGWSWKRDQDGDSVGTTFTHTLGSAVAIGVSGTHEQGLHLIDPRADVPTHGERPLQSAFVAHSSAAEADALSTALYVAGWERGAKLLHELPAASPPAAVIDAESIPAWNAAFHRLWQVPQQWLASLALLLVTGLSAASYADEAVDLSALGATADTYNPYIVERQLGWAALPLLMLALVLLHLKKYRPPTKKRSPIAPTPKN